MKLISQVFIIIGILMYGCLFAQELPPIEGFSPQEYDADNQNWDISQASNKFIYVANGADGLAVFTKPEIPGIAPELVFTWDMNEPNAAPANFIEVDGSQEWIVIAKGLGGTKILRRPQPGDYLPISNFDSQGVPENLEQIEVCDVLLSNVINQSLPNSLRLWWPKLGG